MNEATPLLDELQALIADREQDRLTAEGARRLEQLVVDDLRARRFYVDYMIESSSLHWWAGHAAAVAEPLNSATIEAAPSNTVEAAPPLRPTRRLMNLFEYQRYPLQFALFLATLTLVSFVLTTWQLRIEPVQVSSVASSLNSPQLPVADVVAEQGGARWSDDASASRGAELRVGRRIHLLAGLAEVRFRNGAQLVLQGPASLRVLNANTCDLHFGKLAAKINRSAVGFTIETPAARIVDLGTEFGVDVAPHGAAIVQVFDGEVQVTRRAAADAQAAAAPQTFRVVAGQRLDLSPSTAHAAAVQPFVGEGNFVRQLSAAHAPSPPRSQLRTAIFQQGAPDPITGAVYQGCDDTVVAAWAPMFNFGGRRDFDIGSVRPGQPAHALIRFDLSSLRGKVERVERVVLRLTTTDADYSPAGLGEIQLHLLNERNAAWEEGSFGTGMEGNPASGNTTWNWLQHPQRAWAGFAGASRGGVDYALSPVAKQWYFQDLPHGSIMELEWSTNLAAIERWIEGQENAGLFLKNGVENAASRLNFHSSEALEINTRPVLLIEYRPREVAPPTPPAAHAP